MENNLHYSAGHPWYYVLGGPVLSPKQIAVNTKASGYKGCQADDIQKASDKQLRKIRRDVLQKYRRDLSQYRQAALLLHRFRSENPDAIHKPECEYVHTVIFLKHNHLCNVFAHLFYIEERLQYQPDLFPDY